jgi:small subunit ribosomal protein S4
VNGEIVNIASYSLRSGDIIAVRERSKSLEAVAHSVAARTINKFSWLEWDANSLTGKFLNLPSRDEIPENIKENLIVELYSK